MTQRYIRQVVQRFADELRDTQTRTMTLTLRAQLLHEAKRLQSTLNALLLQKELPPRELLLLGSLAHFITCARLETAEVLKGSCSLFQQELCRAMVEGEEEDTLPAAA